MRMFLRAGAIALALCLTLGGCAEVQKLEGAFQAVTGNVVPPQDVDVAINAFDAIKAIGLNYIRRPACGKGTIICRTLDVTASVKSWISAGTNDRNQLKAALRANPSQNLSVVSIYNDLTGLTAKLTAALPIAGK